MNNHRWIRLLAIGLCSTVTAASAQDIHFRLTGNLGEYKGDTTLIVRNYLEGDTIGTVDVRGGEILPMEGTLARPALAIITRGKAYYIALIEDGETHFTPEETTGGPLCTEFMRLQGMWAAYQAHMEEATGANADLLTATWVQEASASIRAHAGDVVGLFTLMQSVDVLPATQALDLLESVKAAYEGSEAPPVLAQLDRYVRSMVAKEESIGKPFIDFAVEYEGTVTRLSDYVGRGQYVLADFWASWCGPCKQEIPNLISVYDEFKDRGLVVLGVATWDKPEATLAAIDALGINYPQILNAQKIGSDAYGITGIPEIILFSPDGIILARGLRGPAIRQKVAALLTDE